MEDKTKQDASLLRNNVSSGGGLSATPSRAPEQYEVDFDAMEGSLGGFRRQPFAGQENKEQKGMMRIMGERKLRLSVIVAGSLIVGLGFLVAMILHSYPDNGDQAIPVVRADKVAFKEVPTQPGGMDIANRDSTVYDSFRSSSSEREVENLLRESGQPMDKLEAFAKQVEEKIQEQEMVRQAQLDEMESEQDVASVDDESILQQISPASGEETAVKPSSKPAALHKPGQSPDTIEFVRSVLKEKEEASTSASAADNEALEAASVEPAAGAAISAPRYTAGLYFVQLASIQDRSRASGEWEKLVKSYPTILNEVKYRVMKAELPNGTYYRIQAGPFSKTSANQICNSIKAQKAGGCFILK